MPEGTGLDAFRDKFPSRYFDVGIAEEHAATFAAGLAAGGVKPIVALYSTFAQRCYDQILHDICLQKLPVVFALDRAGLVGEDGPTHHGVFDLSFLRDIPNLILAAPADENEMQHMLKTAFDAKAPFVLRYPRGTGFGVKLDDEPQDLPIGKGVWLKKGKDATILAIGNRVHPALAAVEALKKHKMLAGGFGSAVAEYLADKQANFKLLRLGIGDEFVEHGKVANLFDKLGLNAGQMTDHILKWIK